MSILKILKHKILWVEEMAYANGTKVIVARFLSKEDLMKVQEYFKLYF